MSEFKPFPKIPRMNRTMIITEKIDGTNGAIHIENVDGELVVSAQSRNRLITLDTDNFGFARWVHDRANVLASTLGEGIHFGEFWGNGIQRGYGLPNGDKRFSLFNTSKWTVENTSTVVPGLSVVPVLYEGPFNTSTANGIVEVLKFSGSKAAPGFDRPEGIIVFHTAANSMFKVICEKDAEHKGQS